MYLKGMGLMAGASWAGVSWAGVSWAGVSWAVRGASNVGDDEV